MNAQVRITRMLRQSGDLLAHPNPQTFSYYGSRASDSDALTYVAIAAFLQTILGFAIAGGGDAFGLLYSVINHLFEFYIFAGVTYFVGKQFAGIGNFEEVTYTFALFYVPIVLISYLLLLLAVLTNVVPVALISVIPFLQLATLAFYAFQGVQGVLRVRRKRDAALTVGIALIVIWVLEQVFRSIGSGGIY
jgi:hypothetical protein